MHSNYLPCCERGSIGLNFVLFTVYVVEGRPLLHYYKEYYKE